MLSNGYVGVCRVLWVEEVVSTFLKALGSQPATKKAGKAKWPGNLSN